MSMLIKFTLSNYIVPLYTTNIKVYKNSQIVHVTLK